MQEQASALCYKAWNLGELGRHEEAIASSAEAARLAQQVGHMLLQAITLRYKAWSLGQLGRLEEALTSFDQAVPCAREARDFDGLVDALRWRSYFLQRHGRLSAALETIQAALTVTDPGVSTQERRRARGLFFVIAAQIAAPGVLGPLTDVLQETNTDDRWFDPLLGDVLAAVTRAEAWDALQACIQSHASWFAHARPARVFNTVGPVWAEFVAERGRATAFAIVVRNLPSMAAVMRQIPLRGIVEPGSLVQAHLRDLIAGLVSHCADAGFLRDLAPLIVEVFGIEATGEAQRLRAFAEFHAATDKERVLQRFDPDLAKAIRRMWQLPEPEDVLARRGRPKGR